MWPSLLGRRGWTLRMKVCPWQGQQGHAWAPEPPRDRRTQKSLRRHVPQTPQGFSTVLSFAEQSDVREAW